MKRIFHLTPRSQKGAIALLLLLPLGLGQAFAITDALKIKIAGNGYSDETIIRFVAGATEGFDASYDAWKLFSTNIAVPNIFSKDNAGDELTINAMPEFTASLYKDVFLKIGTAATYSITSSEDGAFAPGVCIMMKDLVTGIVYDMRTSNTYFIALPVIAKTDPARFRVFFSYPADVQTSRASCNNCDDGTATIKKAGESNWLYSVVNSSGNTIASGIASGATQLINALAVGNYTATISSDYTCAETKTFSISGPLTYYSRASGNWSDVNTWSIIGCGGTAASSVPGSANNIVVCPGNSVTMDVPSSCIDISIGGTLSAASSFSVTGNWTNSGTFSAGTQTVYFTGTRMQTISGSSGTALNNLTINNSTPVEALRLNSPITINGILALKDGHITTTASNILTCGSSASISLLCTPQDSSFVKGPMSHVVNVSSGVTKVFPVGEGISYRRFDLTLDQKTAATTTYTAQLENSSAAALGYSLPMTISNVSYIRYHIVTQSPASTKLDMAQARIYFSCAGIDDQVEALPLISVAKDNGLSAWIDLNDTPNGFFCGGTSNWGSALSGTFTSFTGTKFTLTNTGSPDPMPVSLIQFLGEKSGNDVNLFWSTASESNNDFFTIERSERQNENDGWMEIGIVNGAGNSSAELNYQFTDSPETFNLKNPTLYYRLKQTDFNGISRYSNVVAVKMENTSSFSVFPNPSDGKFSVNIIGEKEEEILLRIFDLSAREIYSEAFTLKSQNEIHPIELPSMLSKGVYVVSVTGKSSSQLKKIVLQ